MGIIIKRCVKISILYEKKGEIIMVKELTYKNFRDEIENISPNYYVTYKKSGFISVSYIQISI